jgi:hypothetical protein
MTTKIRIEEILSIPGRGHYILVRPTISGQEITWTEKVYLGNVELDRFLEVPKKAKENGDVDLDLYIVKLKNDHEVFRLQENTIVELVPGKQPCLPPWHFADKGLNNQLNLEISRGHVLYGKDIKTIATRQDNDDVLFAVFDSEFKYAKVHLTWSQSRLTDTNYSMTKTYKDWEDVYENLFIPDSKDWE